MAHSKLSGDPLGGSCEKIWRRIRARSLKKSFGLRFKTEQPSAIEQEFLALSERDPAFLFLHVNKNTSVSTIEVEGYGCELADALTGSIQPFAKGAICIIPVLVEQDKPDTWNTAAQAALQTAKRTIPDGRLIMTAAKCQGIERAAFIAIGLGAFMEGQRDLKQCSEREIKMRALQDLKAHRDEVSGTFETLGRIVYSMTEIMDTPRIFRQTESQAFVSSGIKHFASDKTSARILCGESTKDTLFRNGYEGLAVQTFDDFSENTEEHEGIGIAVVLTEETREFQAFAEKNRLFQRKELWIIANATAVEWMSPKSPAYSRHEEEVVQTTSNPPPKDPPQSQSWSEQEFHQPLRILLMGKTGVGKSSLMSSILGEVERPISTSALANTKQCTPRRIERIGGGILLVDTPDLVDGAVNHDQMATSLGESIKMLHPGPHAFVLVVAADSSERDVEDTVGSLQEFLGTEVLSYFVIVIVNREHDAARTPEDSGSLYELLRKNQLRHTDFTYNSSPEKKARQVQELLKKVEDIKKSKNGSLFTHVMYETMTRSRQQTAENPGRAEEREAKADRAAIGRDLEIRLQNMRNEY